MKTPSKQQNAPTAQKLTCNGGTASIELMATHLMQRRQQQQRGLVAAKQPRGNITGLRCDLKAGMENLCGYNLDKVRVHYNSTKPLAVLAEAYTQGYDIHLARGQEKHLPHELGHVVQQMRGRVPANGSISGMALNDDTKLEEEASWLGNTALLQNAANKHDSVTRSVTTTGANATQPLVNGPIIHRGAPIQRMLRLTIKDDIKDDDFLNTDTQTIGKIIEQIQDKHSIYEYATWYIALTHDSTPRQITLVDDETNPQLDTDIDYTSMSLTRLISTRYLIVGNSVKGMTRIYVGDKTNLKYYMGERKKWANSNNNDRNQLFDDKHGYASHDPWLLRIHEKCNAGTMDFGHAQLMVRLSLRDDTGVLKPGLNKGKWYRAFKLLYKNYEYSTAYGQPDQYAWVVNSTWQPSEGRAIAEGGAKNAKTREEVKKLATDQYYGIAVGTLQMIIAAGAYIDNSDDKLTDAPFTVIATLLPTIMDVLLMCKEGRMNGRIFGTSIRLIAEALSAVQAQFGTDDGCDNMQIQVGGHNVHLREISIVLHGLGYVGDMLIYHRAVRNARRLEAANLKLGTAYVQSKKNEAVWLAMGSRQANSRVSENNAQEEEIKSRESCMYGEEEKNERNYSSEEEENVKDSNESQEGEKGSESEIWAEERRQTFEIMLAKCKKYGQ